VERLRDALLMYLLLAIIAYVAVKLVAWAVPTHYHAIPLAPIAMALDPGLYLDPHRSADRHLIDALDGPAYLAMAASAFFAFVGAARALAPRTASPVVMARVFGAALAPLWAWVDACAAAADALLGAGNLRDSLLVAALAAYVTHLAIRLADVAAIALDYPDPPLAALRGALYAPAAIAAIPAGAHHALLRAMDSIALLSMLGAAPLMASIASRAAGPACARLWRRA